MKAIFIKPHEMVTCAFCKREITDEFMYERSFGLLCEDCASDI